MDDKVMTALFPVQMQRRRNGCCPLCGVKVDLTKFVSDLDVKEFKISGICKKCQDVVFGEEESV